jgi:AhpD family alkylhydroperoxidase
LHRTSALVDRGIGRRVCLESNHGEVDLPQTTLFKKRIFTPVTFAASTRDLFAHLADLRSKLRQHRINRSFAERIMLAVTQVNGCRYCSYGHTRMALKAGIPAAELRNLLSGEFNQSPEEELPALFFAQHYAEQQGTYTAAAWQQLEATYGSVTARDILAHIRLISFANLYGNTFDALLSRFKGQPAAGSHWLDEVAFLIVGGLGVPLGLMLGLMINSLTPRHRATNQRGNPIP